jgi:hypothetical protein
VPPFTLALPALALPGGSLPSPPALQATKIRAATAETKGS